MWKNLPSRKTRPDLANASGILSVCLHMKQTSFQSSVHRACKNGLEKGHCQHQTLNTAESGLELMAWPSSSSRLSLCSLLLHVSAPSLISQGQVGSPHIEPSIPLLSVPYIAGAIGRVLPPGSTRIISTRHLPGGRRVWFRVPPVLSEFRFLGARNRSSGLTPLSLPHDKQGRRYVNMLLPPGGRA